MAVHYGERVTLKDIALACGFSANTVSRALRNDTKLSEATRKLIAQTAQDMGYIRNSSASTLRSGRSYTIAVIVNDITNPYYSNMLEQIDQCLHEQGYHMMILCSHQDEMLASQMIEIAISQSVDGILFSPFNTPMHVHALNRSGIPFVLMDRRIAGASASIARLNDEMGGYLAARHLLELGHRKLLYIAGPFINSSQMDRQTGIHRAFTEFGLPLTELRVLPWDRLPEVSALPGNLRQLLQPLDFSAVICFNDVLAYHCMNVLREIGVRIPEDISLVGFDHIRWRSSYLPPLTSITGEQGSVARPAVELLLEQIHHPGLPPQDLVFPVRLELNGTTGPAPC